MRNTVECIGGHKQTAETVASTPSVRPSIHDTRWRIIVLE
jgi:hypothetical protein